MQKFYFQLEALKEQMDNGGSCTGIKMLEKKDFRIYQKCKKFNIF